MDQLVLKLPESLLPTAGKRIEAGKLEGMSLVAQDSQHFTFTLDGKKYPASLVNLPCILETQKTFDDYNYYKSGEISQMIEVFENEEAREKAANEPTPRPSGITPPTTNITKRKYARTKKNVSFPKEDIIRVEDVINRLMQGGPVEEVYEDIVPFQDWMVDEAHPQGIVIEDEISFIKAHPELLELCAPYTKPVKNEKSKRSLKTQSKQKMNLENEIFGDNDVDMEDS